MSRERSRSRCARRLESLAGSTLDIDSLRLEAIEELRHAIGFDFWGVPLVDPETLIPNRVLVSDVPPWGGRLPERWVLDQRVSEVNSRAMLARGRDHVGVLSAATGGDLARCRRWRELGASSGMGDELRAAVVDEQGCWGSFELFRSSDQPRFDSDDAQLMRDAARILACALRQGHVTAVVDGASAYGQSGVLLIDERLRPRGVTETARAWFTLLDSRYKPERTPLPIHVYQVVGRLLTAEAGEDPHRPPRVRVRASDGRWAIVEAARVDRMPDTVAVSIRTASTEDVLALVSRIYGLSPRERELVALLLTGLDTREIATRMFISRYTVNHHLKSVFAKLGIHSRRELATRLFGQTA